MNQTYDPILESLPLKRFRTTAPRGPAIGTVLVLERSVGAPVVVESGAKVPDAYTGNYHTLHRLDVANRAVGFTMSAPSADPAFPFTVVISCGCQIVDPVAIVRDGVRDMAAAVQSWLTGVVRRLSARHDVLRPSDAEADIMSALNGASTPPAVRLSRVTVEVHTRDVAEIVTAQREARVQELRRDAMRPVARGGREEMLAHVMGMTGGDPTPLLDREQQAREASTKASLNALSALMNSDKMEEFNTSRISERVMTEFFGNDPLVAGTRGGIRDRIERKRKAIDGAGPVIDGERAAASADAPLPPRPDRPADAAEPGLGERTPRDAAPPDEPRPDGEAPKPNRVRGLLRNEGG